MILINLTELNFRFNVNSPSNSSNLVEQIRNVSQVDK